MSEREEYLTMMKAQLDQWDAEIEKQQVKAREAEADTRMQYEDQIAEMQKQREEAETMIRELQDASDDAWQDMKSGFETGWNNIANAFNSAASRTVS